MYYPATNKGKPWTNYIIEHYEVNIGFTDEEKQAMQDESTDRGTSTVVQNSSSDESGGIMKTIEKEELVDINTTTNTESSNINKVDIVKTETTNKVIRSQTKKLYLSI